MREYLMVFLSVQLISFLSIFLNCSGTLTLLQTNAMKLRYETNFTLNLYQTYVTLLLYYVTCAEISRTKLSECKNHRFEAV